MNLRTWRFLTLLLEGASLPAIALLCLLGGNACRGESGAERSREVAARDSGAREDPAPPDTMVMEVGGPLTRPPEAPIRIEGACPFECCTYGAWTTTALTTVYEEPDGTAASRTVPAGTHMEAISGHVLITRVGVAMIRDTLRLYREDGSSLLAVAGDTLLVLDEIGEGYRRVWRRGAIYQTDAASGLNEAPGASSTELLVEPERQWWARVRGADGAPGWLWMGRTPRMEGVDACS